MNKLIEIKNVTAKYDRHIVLNDVSLDVWEKDFLVLTGPNGGGKTTLLKLILQLLRPSNGQIYYFKEGRQVSFLKIGYLPQMNPFDRQFPISVYDVVASGLADEKKVFKDFNRNQKESISKMLAEVGLTDYASQAIGKLSGGQFQRALLARAMISTPELLILDEPNTYIDKEFEMHFIELMKKLNKQTSIVLVTHDTSSIAKLSQNIIYINTTITKL